MKYILTILILLNITLNAKYVKASGAGSSCNTAVNDALQNAVKSVAGAKIKSSTKVSMGELESDKIFSSTDGLVRGYKQISKDTEPGYCEVTLKVNVLEGKVEDSIDSFIKNKSSMRMFQKTSFKDRSVVVLYSTRDMEGAFKKNSRAVVSLMDDIQDQLREMEFDIILEDGLEGMPNRTIKDKDAIGAAERVGADAVVLATLLTSGIEKTGNEAIIYSNALVKAYEPSTRRLFANVNKRARNMSRAGSKFALEDGKARSAIKTAKAAVPSLVKKIVKNLSTGSKKVIRVKIKKIPSRVQRKMRKAFRNNELDFKIVKRQGEYVGIEFNTDQTLTDFEDTIYDLWDDEKLKGCLDTAKSYGSAIDFVWMKNCD